MLKKSSIKNPCIHVCTLDEEGVCMGCYRTKEEIQSWFRLTDEEKRAVLEKTELRRREKEDNISDRYA